jgi:hypothetical protein
MAPSTDYDNLSASSKMRIKISFLLCVILCITGGIFAQIPSSVSERPKAGFVPDKETAIAIAQAVWTPIYGKKTILKERPFRTTLTNNIWIVQGSLPEGYNGGVAVAEISKEDGRILRVYHGK